MGPEKHLSRGNRLESGERRIAPDRGGLGKNLDRQRAVHLEAESSTGGKGGIGLLRENRRSWGNT